MRDASAGVGKEVTGARTLTYQVANHCWRKRLGKRSEYWCRSAWFIKVVGKQGFSLGYSFGNSPSCGPRPGLIPKKACHCRNSQTWWSILLLRVDATRYYVRHRFSLRNWGAASRPRPKPSRSFFAAAWALGLVRHICTTAYEL